MRTTLYLDDKLLKEVKRCALEEGTTFTAFTAEALRNSLRHKQNARKSAQKIKLPVFKGTGLQPGIDLNDSAALLEVMER